MAPAGDWWAHVRLVERGIEGPAARGSADRRGHREEVPDQGRGYLDSTDCLGKTVVLLSDIPNRPYLGFEWPSRA